MNRSHNNSTSNRDKPLCKHFMSLFTHYLSHSMGPLNSSVWYYLSQLSSWLLVTLTLWVSSSMLLVLPRKEKCILCLCLHTICHIQWVQWTVSPDQNFTTEHIPGVKFYVACPSPSRNFIHFKYQSNLENYYD